MSFWQRKNVLVTGGAGFIGSHLIEMLVQAGSLVRVADNLINGKLDNLKSCIDKIEFVNVDLNQFENCLKVTKDMDIVLNLVAKVAGIDFNKKHSGTMFYKNVLPNLSVLEAARINEAERFLVVSSACVYPRYCTIPTPETEGFKEDPEPSNFGYGWAKRVLEIQAKAYSDEFDMKIGIVRPYNSYGPRDHFDETIAHVIPALIRRVFAGEDPLNVWGDGEQTRAFIYVKDLAQGMMLAAEKYPVPDPLNIGTEEEIKIKDLVKLIVEISGLKPKIIFDSTKPAGQPRRNADITKAQQKIGFKANTALKQGLNETIQWYLNNVIKR